MAAPVVTAVIPTFRRAALLKRAIVSVLSQTRSELCVLVCDNASDDGTGEVVAELSRRDPRVIYHRHATNRGAYFNFQYGVDAVESEYFSILSDDDLLLPDLYRRAVAALERDPSSGFYCSQVVLYDAQRGTHSLRPSRHWRAGRHEAGESARLMTEHHFVWTSCVFRKTVRDAVGPFETIPMGDVLFLGKAAALFPFFVELVPGALFTETGANFSHTMPLAELSRSWETARAWAASLPGQSAADRDALLGVLDWKLKTVAHGMIRAAAESGDWARFQEAADYLLARGDLSPRRRARIAFARRGGAGSWQFNAVRLFTRLQSGYKRRRAGGWKTMSVEEVLAAYREAQ